MSVGVWSTAKGHTIPYGATTARFCSRMPSIRVQTLTSVIWWSRWIASAWELPHLRMVCADCLICWSILMSLNATRCKIQVPSIAIIPNVTNVTNRRSMLPQQSLQYSTNKFTVTVQGLGRPTQTVFSFRLQFQFSVFSSSMVQYYLSKQWHSTEIKGIFGYTISAPWVLFCVLFWVSDPILARTMSSLWSTSSSSGF
jgi:hypothetical protein